MFYLLGYLVQTKSFPREIWLFRSVFMLSNYFFLMLSAFCLTQFDIVLTDSGGGFFIVLLVCFSSDSWILRFISILIPNFDSYSTSLSESSTSDAADPTIILLSTALCAPELLSERRFPIECGAVIPVTDISVASKLFLLILSSSVNWLNVAVVPNWLFDLPAFEVTFVRLFLELGSLKAPDSVLFIYACEELLSWNELRCTAWYGPALVFMNNLPMLVLYFRWCPYRMSFCSWLKFSLCFWLIWLRVIRVVCISCGLRLLLVGYCRWVEQFLWWVLTFLS